MSVKPKPYRPGLVKGQLPRTPLRVATEVEVITRLPEPERHILEYPNHAETPNEKSKRQLQRLTPKSKVHRAIAKLDIPTGGWIL